MRLTFSGMSRLIAFLVCAVCVADVAQAQVVTPDKPFVPRLARDISTAQFIDLARCKPDYPRASRIAEEQGSVTVSFEVAADGEAKKPTIVRSSGFRNLDRATVNGLSECLFRPAFADGKPYDSILTTLYQWRLQD